MNTRKQQGFTIIEVVLVLAIAGLIFLMVFIALPALQRGQRDTGRKNDVSTVAAAINSYRSNNKGSFFNGATLQMNSAALQAGIDTLSQYEKTTVTVTDTVPGAAVTPSNDSIEVYVKAKCGVITADKITVVAGSARQAAVVTALENNGATKAAYCQDV